VPKSAGVIKRLLLGRALASDRHAENLLPKWLALPVFCSDPISSVAYATEQILLVAGLGGAAYLWLASPIAVAVAVLLAVVVLSYRQTCHAYPSGGGAFVVSLDNFGEKSALTAAAALLVDYVMTVAVSVVAGVLAITSKFPNLQTHAVLMSVIFVVFLALVNLRGLQDSGRAFAVPTYAFILLTFLLLGTALYKATLGGGLPLASGASEHLIATEKTGGYLTVLLALRAFASGCTALTGVEAISNGVPAFRPPKAKNAATTLVMMGALAIVMFSGVTVLALHMKARAYRDGFPSVISQLGAGVWGSSSPIYLLFQLATAGILILAANTAFNGFPVLASILAQHSYLPRQLQSRGDRLIFSNGVLLLAGFAIVLIVGFNANIDKLIQLYIVGVFTSFTLSQAGMVRHWNRLIRVERDVARQHAYRRSQLINAVGAGVTALVLIIVVRYKFTGGAYIAMLAMAVLFMLMMGINRYYQRVSDELVVDEGASLLRPSRIHAVVLVSRIHLPTIRALAYAQATRPSDLTALTVSVDPDEARELQEQWWRRDIDVPLTIIDSPYREMTQPVLEYVRKLRRDNPRDVVTVFIPEYVVGRWWEHFLHNQSALRLKSRLLFQPGVMVTSVPYQLRSTEGKQGWGLLPDPRGELPASSADSTPDVRPRP
jgi:amino acid transporter